ncbi:MAG: GNAT family N-acetyltransferase, partial [Clostridia bacterium]|nr:GNAT family N-acetyltransferase [Clostridia bacterium]
AGSSYVAVENGKIRACVGAFDHDISVCGERIATRGIGNVAVHPYERSRGFMRKLMNMAVEDMKKDGIALSVLGGRRQRYMYFGYDRGGTVYSMSFNSDNIRHTFGKGYDPFFAFRRVSSPDDSALADIRLLSESYPLFAIRPEGRRYFETLVSWGDKVCVFTHDGEFAGYCLYNDTTVSEVLLTEKYRSDFALFVRDFFGFIGKGGLKVKLPLYLSDYFNRIKTVGESYSLEICKSFCVLNFKKVAGAFMKLASTVCRLPDGELAVSIDGIGGRENLLFAVHDGVPSVTEAVGPCDMNLTHFEAMNLFFASTDPSRLELPGFARAWLPLPLAIYHADTV